MDKFSSLGEIFSGGQRATLSLGWGVFRLRKIQNGRERNGIRKTVCRQAESEGGREEQERMEKRKRKELSSVA